MYQKIIRLWPLLLILLFAFVLRIINLEKLFYFTYDESVFAFVGRRLILWNHIPLIGGATPFGFHVAPYFYWFFALPLGIGNLNPIAWGWTSAIIATLTAFMMYQVGKAFGNRRVGFLAAAFWTFSYLANVYDRHFWGLTFGPLFSLIVLYCLYQIKNGRQNFIYLLGFVLALIIHADLSYYVFLAMAAVSWIVFKLPINKKTALAVAFIVISFLPLVVFDLRHNFANVRPVADFLNSGRNTPGFEVPKFTENLLLFPRSAARFIYTPGDNEVVKQYSYCKNFVVEKFSALPAISVLAAAIILLHFVYWSWRKNSSTGWRLVSLILILHFVGIQIYGTILRADIFEHYLTGIFSIYILIFALFVSRIPKKFWLLVLGLFVAANLYKFSQAQNSQGLTEKRQAIEYTVQKVGDKPFSLDSLSTCWKLNGYRYLFTVFGREPVKSYVDPNFAYLYGTTPVWENHPETVVAFVVHDFVPETSEFHSRYALLKSHEVSSKTFGTIEVIILDNSGQWFDKVTSLP
ncbi:MAG: hypothetical protein WD988_00325 [Candidatus Curtissbacteria bacterium]